MLHNKIIVNLIHILSFLLIILISGCKSQNKKSTDLADSIEVVEIDEKLITEIKTAKQIFYSLPSPLETAMLIKRAGATFNPEILNAIENVNNYVTSKSMALNLGIYSTDLSYASLFDQTQYSIQYMTAAQKMVDGLGITDAITNETLQELQDNINHRDVIMDIISEAFMNSSSFLKENDRSAISAMVLIGGWIEGLYIATRLIDPFNLEDNDLVDRLIDQKLSLTNVIKLLEENKDDEDVADIIVLINELKVIYDQIKVSTTPITAEKEEGSEVTKLKSVTTSTINKEQFVQLSNKIEAIRNNFII
ncbi:MAG: hypothetical protein JXB17_06055 [Bacteroidales bacterium]|nr:hypothetical protein [Bacteroidales bacterium]